MSWKWPGAVCWTVTYEMPRPRPWHKPVPHWNSNYGSVMKCSVPQKDWNVSCGTRLACIQHYIIIRYLGLQLQLDSGVNQKIDCLQVEVYGASVISSRKKKITTVIHLVNELKAFFRMQSWFRKRCQQCKLRYY